MVGKGERAIHGSSRRLQIRKGISWNLINLVVNKGVVLFVRLLLARLLTPEHFGLIAMILVFIGLVKIVVDLGMQNALIQKTRDATTHVSYHTAFWFLLAVSLLWCAFYIVALVPTMSWLYAEPALYNLAVIMGISIPLYSLSILPQVILLRRMRLKQVAVAEVMATLFASVIAIILAILGAGVWSLAGYEIVNSGLRSLIIWKISRWRPRLVFNHTTIYPLLPYSTYMLGSRFVYFVRTNIDTLSVGVILGAVALGNYSIAYSIGNAARQGVSSIVSSVLFPAFSRVSNNTDLLRMEYTQATRVMVIATFPPSLLGIVLADYIPIFLGDAWISTVPVVRVLLIVGLIYGLSGPAAEILTAVGAVKELFRKTLVNLAFVAMPTIMLLTYMMGIIGTALAMVISQMFIRVSIHSSLVHHVNIRSKDVLWQNGYDILLALLIISLSFHKWPGKEIFLVLVLIVVYFPRAWKHIRLYMFGRI